MVHSYQRFHGNQNGTNKRHKQAICFLGPCRMQKYSVLYCERKCTRNYAGPALSHLVNSHFRTILWEMEFQIQTLSHSNRYIF